VRRRPEVFSNRVSLKARGCLGSRGVNRAGFPGDARTRAGHDDWFVREVESGLAQIDQGRTWTDAAVGAREAKKLAGSDPRALMQL
jgi:hypothetical protein